MTDDFDDFYDFDDFDDSDEFDEFDDFDDYTALEWNQAKLSEGYHFDSEFWILAHFYLKGIYLFVALAYSLLHKRLRNKWDILFWDNECSTGERQ